MRQVLFLLCVLSATSVFAQKTIKTGFVVIDGVYNSELVAPFDILQHSPYHSKDHYFETFVISPEGKPVKTAEGLVIQADYSFSNVPALDVLVIPSTQTSMDKDLEDGPYADFIRGQVDKVRVVMTLCDGAFALANTGRLNGKHATTYPGDQQRFADTFKKIEVHRDVWFVQDGKFITSVGGAKSYEPALFLAHQWFGEKVAKGLARGLVIDWDLDKIPHKTFAPLPTRPE